LTDAGHSSVAVSSLDYDFADSALLQRALTHRSASTENNERLEFLGDAVLGQVIAEYLYRHFPHADEGQLTRTRAQLVNKDTLASVARSLDLGGHIRLGEGELKSGGWRRDSILANTLEALIGAIYLDGGLAPCIRQISTWFEGALKDVDPALVHKDAKTRLQEYLQARGQALPVYTAVEVAGPAHDQQFTIECRVESVIEPVRAEGKNRRSGEQRAAALMLERLENGAP
jgi:ribonuclease-3